MQKYQILPDALIGQSSKMQSIVGSVTALQNVAVTIKLHAHALAVVDYAR